MESGEIKKKKILFLITKSNWGGAQRYVFDLATNLPKDRFDVSVALGGDGPLRQKLEAAEIDIYPIKNLARDISLQKEVRSFIEIANVIRQMRPDVLHINSSKAGGLGALIGRVLGVRRVIFTAHGWAFNEDRPSWQKLILTFFHWVTVLLAHHTIAVSQALKTQLNWPGAQARMTVVYNGRKEINFLTRDDARHELTKIIPALDAHTNDLWTGTIGELHPVKCHGVMIEAMAQLVAEGHQLRHLIIGTGELAEKLTQRIQEKNLQEYIFLMGHIDEAARFLKALDIYVQPSRSEALAYTVIEAAQAGLPIVASRVGGIPEIITDQLEGVLVAPEDPDTLQKALAELIKAPERAHSLGVAAHKKSNVFLIDRVVMQTIAVYAGVNSSTL